MRVALVAQRPNQTNLALAARSWNGRPIELIERQRELPDIDVPAVVKPRFGSWGREVTLCRDRRELERTVERLVFRPWFRTGGAIAQELIPPLGHDLRVIVAGGTVVGAGRRDAAPGEWRTNVALGATVSGASPSPVAVALARAATEASRLELVGVDLLPTGPGGFCILELNGAVDFRPALAGTELEPAEPASVAGALA